MTTKRITKVVGKISDDIIDKYQLYEYRNKDIVQSLDLYAHIHKHINDFKSIDSFNHSIFSIPDIISKPLFVTYDRNRNALHYFKKIDENVCIVVKLNIKKHKDIYVSTIYPVSDTKLNRYKELSYIVGKE